MEQIKGIIFDLDGTLVSSSLDFKAIRAEINCPADVDVLAFVEQLSDGDKQRVMAIIHRHEVADASTSDWLPGAREFVHKCIDEAIPMAIVTRNSEHCAQLKIKRNQIPIETLVAREHARPKPDPTALLDLSERFGLTAAEVLMVGDYRYDLEAGRNAKMPACLLHFDEPPDYIHLADYSYSDFSGLHRAMFG